MKKDVSEDTKEAAVQRRRQHLYNQSRNTYLKREYGISLEEYMILLKSQNNSCAICGNSDSGTQTSDYNTFHVDHNHKTGKTRGLLCSTCNIRVLPAVEFYSGRLAGAELYLKKYGN